MADESAEVARADQLASLRAAVDRLERRATWHTVANLLPTVDIVRYRAEARFLRALSYWHAIDLFGNVPFVDENSPVGSTAVTQCSAAAPRASPFSPAIGRSPSWRSTRSSIR